MNQTPAHSVHWHEGMFLCPQHLQEFSRHVDRRIHEAAFLGLPGVAGLYSLEYTETAIAQDILEVRSAHVVFPDGTVARFPANAVVKRRSFKELFTAEKLDVFLGIPSQQAGIQGLGEADDERARFHTVAVEFADENQRNDQRPIEMRILHGRLFFGHEDRTGFACLRIARIVRQGRPEPVSTLDPEFIPDVLRIAASTSLVRRLRETTSALRSHARDLATRLPELAGIAAAERGPELGGFLKLQAVNQCLGPLQALCEAGDLHPYWVYLEVQRAIGTLAAFAGERTLAEPEHYDPLDLNRSLGRSLTALKELVPSQVTVRYDSEAFVADEARRSLYHCRLPAEWDEAQGRFYLAIDLDVGGSEVDALVQHSLKLFAESDLERILVGVLPGIALRHQRNPPHEFPKRPGRHYFQIEVEGAGREAWLKIRKERRATLIWAQAGSTAGFHLFIDRR